MPFIFLFVGLVFLVAALRGKSGDMLTLLQDEFTGPNSFFKWAVGIFVVGSFGYVDKLKPLSDAFLVLVAVVLLLSNDGFFTRLQQDLNLNRPAGGNANAGNRTPAVASLPAIPSIPAIPNLGVV